MAQQMDGRTSFINEQVAQTMVACANGGVRTAFRFEDMLIVQMEKGTDVGFLVKILGPPAGMRTNLHTGAVCFWWVEHP